MEFEGHKDIIISRQVSSGWRIMAAIPLKSLENRTKTIQPCESARNLNMSKHI